MREAQAVYAQGTPVRLRTSRSRHALAISRIRLAVGRQDRATGQAWIPGCAAYYVPSRKVGALAGKALQVGPEGGDHPAGLGSVFIDHEEPADRYGRLAVGPASLAVDSGHEERGIHGDQADGQPRGEQVDAAPLPL